MAVCFFAGSGGGVDTSKVTAGAADVLSGRIIVDANGNALTGTMTNRGLVTHSLAINGTYTIPQGYHNGSGKVTQGITTMAGQTITPTSSAQTVACNGKYMTGNVTVSGSSILKAVSGTATSIYSDSSYMGNYIGKTGSTTRKAGYWTVSLTGFKSISSVFWYRNDPRDSCLALSVSTPANDRAGYTVYGSAVGPRFSYDEAWNNAYYFDATGVQPVISTTLIRLPVELYTESSSASTNNLTINYYIFGTSS